MELLTNLFLPEKTKMPAFIKTKAQEELWQQAKRIASKSGQKGNYAYITGIFKRMGGMNEGMLGIPLKTLLMAANAHESIILEASSSDKVSIKDFDDHIEVINWELIPQEKLEAISLYMKRKGYDSRGAASVQKFFTRIANGHEGRLLIFNTFQDWIDALKKSLGPAPTRKKPAEKSDFDKVLNRFVRRLGGTTDHHIMAGWMLPNGKMVSMGDIQRSTVRSQDHAELAMSVVNHLKDLDFDTDSTYLAKRFLVKNGVIRLMPESPGIEIGALPTRQQISGLRNFIRNFRGSEFYLEILTDFQSRFSEFSRTYPPNISPDRILSDINAYLTTGTAPELPKSITSSV